MAWPATDFLCFLCSSRCGVGESMLRGVELLSKDFFDFPIASLPLVDFSCILTRGICYFYFFLSFRSFTQWLTSFDPNFLPSIWKSPALEKKSGLVILSSEMEQKVSKCDFHESLVSHIGLWAFVCKVLLATHWILPSSNKGCKSSINAQFKIAHFPEHTRKSEFSSARQILPQLPWTLWSGCVSSLAGGGRA